MKLIYIASPFTHPNRKIEEFRFAEATRIAGELQKKYRYALFLPITQSYMMGQYVKGLDGKFADWKRVDLFMVRKKCDEVWVLPMQGWKESVGVQAEIDAALEVGKKVRFVNLKTYKLTKKVIIHA